MIVPGSPFIWGHNHPFSWYARVREKSGAKKEWTYWMNGSEATRETVAEHIARNFPNVEVLWIDRCTKMPDKALQPVPPHHFQFGLLYPKEEHQEETARIKPLWSETSLSPVTPTRLRKPLWPPHR